jgi:hypothetical protein
MTTPAVRGLAVEHQARLEAAGLSPAVIAARGYWTATPADVERVATLGLHRDIVKHGSALMLPLHDVHGGVALMVARPDVPRLDGRGKPLKYEIPRGAKATLDVPPMARGALQDPDVCLWITEGQKKADAAVAAGAGCAIALLGVWNWKKWSLPAWETVTLRHRTVYLAFDSDAMSNPKVTQALRRLRAFLGSRDAHVRLVHLEPGPDGEKVGLDDALAAGATLELLAAGATLELLAAQSTEGLRVVLAKDDKRPELAVSLLHRPVTVAAFAHLAGAGVYRTTQGVVRVERCDGATMVRPLGVPQLRAVLDRVVRCVREGDTGAAPCYPPRDLAEMLVHEPEPPLPILRAVATAPTFTRDGRLLDQAGYDAASGLLLEFAFPPRPVSPAPTADDLAAARAWWEKEALVDFPFATAADRVSALALALTPMVRELIDGPTPLFLVEAPLRGAGKGKLVAACLLPTLGPGGWTVAALPREDDELRKAVTAFLLEQRAAILFDNVVGRLGSAVLAKALTDSVWDDRTLGRSASVRCAVRCTWVVTANNPQLGDEIARRAVPIRLVPETDRPELRRDFRHAELEPWVAAHRADLLWALAVFVRAWQAAGCPSADVPPLGSYEAWSRVVGGILTHAGYADFLGNRETLLAAADPDTATWESFVAAWWEVRGGTLVTVTELLPVAEGAGVHISGETDRARLASLGKALGARRDRFFEGRQLQQGAGCDRRAWRLLSPVTGRDRCDRCSPELFPPARALRVGTRGMTCHTCHDLSPTTGKPTTSLAPVRSCDCDRLTAWRSWRTSTANRSPGLSARRGIRTSGPNSSPSSWPTASPAPPGVKIWSGFSRD